MNGLARAFVEQRALRLDPQLGPGEIREPAVDRAGAEVEHHRVETATIERHRRGPEELEAQLGGDRLVRLEIDQGKIDPAQRRTHLHIDTLDVEPAGGRGARVSLSFISGRFGLLRRAGSWLSPAILPSDSGVADTNDRDEASVSDSAGSPRGGRTGPPELHRPTKGFSASLVWPISRRVSRRAGRGDIGPPTSSAPQHSATNLSCKVGSRI